jgi:hypothetical protein
MKKTVVFTIAGNNHKLWKEIANTAGCHWHDNDAPASLIYLGYPVYHNPTQLGAFLANIHQKIVNYAGILNGGNLSVQGKALLANSMLLSRLWYIIRVTIVPKEWLTLCRKTIKQYIYPPNWIRTLIASITLIFFMSTAFHLLMIGFAGLQAVCDKSGTRSPNREDPILLSG